MEMFEELNKVVKKILKKANDICSKNSINIYNEEIYDKIEDKVASEYKDWDKVQEITDRIYCELMKEIDKWIEKLDIEEK